MESILNEYNYVKGWTDRWLYPIEMMSGLKGAIFTAGCFLCGQNNPLDMLMYYDARICGMSCIFDILTMRPKKGYHSFVAFSRLAELGSQVKAETDDFALWCVSAADESGSKYATMIVYYEDNDGVTKPKGVTIRS